MAVHKNFRGRTIIRHDAGVVGNFGRALLQGLQRVNLEDPVFEQAFEVAASNQVEARYLLTPSFMERLLELSRSFGGAALQGSFHQGSLFLMIPHRSLLFRPASITEYEDFIDDSQAVLKAMNKIFSVIETLKMDMDIKLCSAAYALNHWRRTGRSSNGPRAAVSGGRKPSRVKKWRGARCARPCGSSVSHDTARAG